MKRIAAVIVTYNRKDLLMLCIDHLMRQDLSAVNTEANEPAKKDSNAGIPAKKGSDAEGYVLDILVVDNASTDGTEAELAPLHNAGIITYFNTGANLGGAGGFNFGMRKAVESDYDYVWVMDDDCLPHPTALQELILAGKKLNGNYGFLSSKVLWKDGSICTFNRQRHPLTKTIENFDLDLQPATLASFVSLFVPTRVIRELGLPIKDFFIWSDDWEFTRRISREYPCYVVGKSVVAHYSNNNGRGNIALDAPDRTDRYRLAYRNDVYWYRREGLRGWAFLVTRGLYHGALVLAKSDGAKTYKLKTILQGNLDGLHFHPKIEKV